MPKISYCPRCGCCISRMGSPQMCRSCGFAWYDNQKPSVTVVLSNTKGEVLLVRRKYDPHKGAWATPGGFVERRETAEAAVRREIREELGVTLGPFRYVASLSTPYPQSGVRHRLLELAFAASIVRGKIAPADDVAEARWFAPEEIPYKKLAFANHGKLLRAYLRNR